MSVATNDKNVTNINSVLTHMNCNYQSMSRVKTHLQGEEVGYGVGRK